TGSPGASNNPPTVTNVSLQLNAGALNQANVRVRFRYEGSYDYYWGLDDIEILGNPIPQYAWTAAPNAGAGLPAGAGIANPANAGITVTPTVAGTYIYSATASIESTGCLSPATSITITVGTGGATTWTGVISSAWEDPGNWSCGVPTATSPVTIPGGAVVIINTNANAKSLAASATSSITVNTGFTLTVHN
ncbi:MAG: hypothetical protein ABIQ56_00040, partial [Chitinophagaceae bacterium]